MQDTIPDSELDNPSSAAEADANAGLPWPKIALGIVALGAILYFGRQAGAYVPQFATWVDGLGVWGPAAFILGYIVAVLAFIPGSVLTLAAGAIFGLTEGVIYVFVAATIGATLAFLIARYGARDAIEKRIEGDARFAAIDKAVGAQGRKIVFLLRLSPAFPFNLLNYSLGLTRVRVFDYFIASIGMLPGTILYVYTGSFIGDVAAVAGGAGPESGPGNLILAAVGLIATLAVTVFVTRIARQALAEATGDASAATE